VLLFPTEKTSVTLPYPAAVLELKLMFLYSTQQQLKIGRIGFTLLYSAAVLEFTLPYPEAVL
jgi:hypothetical protein